MIAEPVTRQEIEQKMDELAREYRETHDPEIPVEIFELARLLREMDIERTISQSVSMMFIVALGSVASDTSPVPRQSSS
jgi:metal-sulfur cluster biosynthetic enzyme